MSHICHQGSCKPNTLLIDRHSCREIVLKEVLSRWWRPCHIADISSQRKCPQLSNDGNYVGHTSCNLWWFSVMYNNLKSYPAMADFIRHVDLLNCIKLPRVLASLSRHSNCYVALQLLLAARLAVSRSLPSTSFCKHKSITPINLAGEWNGDGDCFAWVKINTVSFPLAFAHIAVNEYRPLHFWHFSRINVHI